MSLMNYQCTRTSDRTTAKKPKGLHVFIILVEHEIDGRKIIGPFKTEDDADAYGFSKFDENDNNIAWWVEKIHRPKRKRKTKGVSQCDGSQSS